MVVVICWLEAVERETGDTVTVTIYKTNASKGWVEVLSFPPLAKVTQTANRIGFAAILSTLIIGTTTGSGTPQQNKTTHPHYLLIKYLEKSGKGQN